MLWVPLLLLGLSACTDSVDSVPDASPSPHPLEGTIIDVHAHASISYDGASPSDLTTALDEANIGLIVLMNTPEATLQDSSESSDDLVAFFSDNISKVRFLYGGEELNPILHALGRSEAFTEANIFPNGTEGASYTEELQELTDIAAAPDAWETEFMNLATTAAESGNYIGFGELGPYHLSQRSGHPEIDYPANHELLLWLSDLAAEHEMILDIHMEATETKVTELEELLSHNTATKVVWEHAGWSNTGNATADLMASLLADHPNLYLAIKLRDPDTDLMSSAYPFELDGTLDLDWQLLLEGYPEQIMLGTDFKYWQTSGGSVATPADILPTELEATSTLLSLIDAEAASWIQSKTAIEVFNL